MANVLGARPIGGRLAEDMNNVAMANDEEDEPHVPEDSGHYGAPGEGEGETMPEIGSPEHIAQIEKYLSYRRDNVRGIPSFMKPRTLADLATPEVPVEKLQEIMKAHHAKVKQGAKELKDILARMSFKTFKARKGGGMRLGKRIRENRPRDFPTTRSENPSPRRSTPRSLRGTRSIFPPACRSSWNCGPSGRAPVLSRVTPT
jgi:hypothetical protein